MGVICGNRSSTTYDVGHVFVTSQLNGPELAGKLNSDMSFLEDLDVAFGTSDLYAILGLRRNCGEDEIKKAYRKKALQVHPDRAPEGEKEAATKKFQLLGEYVATTPTS